MNPRLFDEQLVYIINHADDRVLLFDAMFLPIVERLRPAAAATVEHFILFDAPAREGYLSYRDLIEAEDGRFEWVELDERDPVGLCYTSGTTGNPRRRSLRASLERHPRDHRNPARRLWPVEPQRDPADRPDVPRQQLGRALRGGDGRLETGVFGDQRRAGPLRPDARRGRDAQRGRSRPSGLAMFGHMDATGIGYGKLERVIIGGSAAPRAMIERFMKAGIAVGHAWG